MFMHDFALSHTVFQYSYINGLHWCFPCLILFIDNLIATQNFLHAYGMYTFISILKTGTEPACTRFPGNTGTLLFENARPPQP